MLSLHIVDAVDVVMFPHSDMETSRLSLTASVQKSFRPGSALSEFAVEERGFALHSLDTEPWIDAGSMSQNLGSISCTSLRCSNMLTSMQKD